MSVSLLHFTRIGGPTLAALALLVVAGVQLGAPAEPADLAAHERSVYSQFGEDGVLEKIFEIVPPGPRYAVEFGASDGIAGSNTRNLILHHGFGALLIEGDEEMARQAAENYRDQPRVTTLQTWVYPGNIEVLMEDAGVPPDLDLLVVDIDSNDYWVWRAIRDFQPKVVAIEYNPGFPPPRKMVIEYSPFNYWDGSDYYGASIQSLYELGKKKGYELVHAESHGSNLFFVRAEHFRRFRIADNSPARLYRMPQYGTRAGRAPNRRGYPAWNLYTERDDEGNEVQPYARPLVWENVTIEKKMILDRH